MNSKKIDDNIKLLQEIKDLDEKILTIDKIAKLAANGTIEAKLGLAIKDLNKKIVKSESDNNQFDFSSYLQNYIEKMKERIEKQYGKGSVQMEYPHLGSNNSFNPDEVYQSNVSNSTVLKVLALIIEDLNYSRTLLVNKINNININ